MVTIKTAALCILLGIAAQLVIFLALWAFITADITLGICLLAIIILPLAALEEFFKSPDNRVVRVLGHYNLVVLTIMLQLGILAALCDVVHVSSCGVITCVNNNIFEASPTKELILLGDPDVEDAVYDFSSIEIVGLLLLAIVAIIIRIYDIIFRSTIVVSWLLAIVLGPICLLSGIFYMCAEISDSIDDLIAEADNRVQTRYERRWVQGRLFIPSVL